MKYFLLMSSILLLPFSADARLSRQEKRPEFFVPESAFTRQEKLPEIKIQNHASRKSTNNHITKPVKEKISNSQKSSTANSKQKAQDMYNRASKSFTQQQFRKMQKTPEYQKKYDEYFEDINQLKRTGYLPANPSLQKDLLKMDGSEKVVR